ncbi:DUF1173 family protein [Achromobacter ruhlandii]|uniref:DUF1173 family protein n=1 Tax=Achromobacter ruhlandii TaxID=72557 RepID=UPI003BA17762
MTKLNERKVIVGDEIVSLDSPDSQAALERAQQAKVRPKCLCRAGGIDMYISKAGDAYIVKRMPGTGRAHAMECDSYEPPEGLSGRSLLEGGAIRENADDGVTHLKFDFSLSKKGAGVSPTPSAGAATTVEADPKRLSLAATLDFLLEEAQFNRWTPAMDGRRNWAVFRKYLRQAATTTASKAGNLGDVLYMPEPFRAEEAQAIVARRDAALAPITAAGQAGRRMMILVAEVKEITTARYGFKIVVRHAPDFHFMLSEDLHKKLSKAFGPELQMWDAEASSHLICIATFSVSPNGYATIHAVALRLLSPQWLSIRSGYERRLLSDIVATRKFHQGLRYTLSDNVPYATVTLMDLAEPVPLYLELPNASDEFKERLQAITTDLPFPSVTWRVADGVPPAIPPVAHARDGG